MTLIIGMSKPEGIYLSADYLVTHVRTGKILDDAATKNLTIHYPPIDNGGPRVLMGFSGLAELIDKTPMMTWIRQTLRGESEVIDQSMKHLLRRLNRDIAPYRAPFIINLLVLEKNRRLMGAFSNLKISPLGQTTVDRRFTYVMQELADWTIFANGCGAHRLIRGGHFDRLRPHLNVVPRKPMNHMNLLALMNRRVAEKDKRVSPYCHVSFINADKRFEPVSHVFTQGKETVPFEMPMLFSGIDLTELTRNLQERTPLWGEAEGKEAVRRRA